jgi:hypothetical protein
MTVIHLQTQHIEGDPRLDYWDDLEAGWDSLWIDNKLMPGVWQITSGECARQVDHKKTKGKDGARIRDQGMLPSRFSAKGQLVSREDWIAMQGLIAEINPRKTGKMKKPLAVYHPAIAFLGVGTIYVERVRVPEIRQGICEISLDMIEWTDTPKASNAAKATKAKGETAEQYRKRLLAQNELYLYNKGIESGLGLALHSNAAPNAEWAAAYQRSGGDPVLMGNILSTGDPYKQIKKVGPNEWATVDYHPPTESLGTPAPVHEPAPAVDTNPAL